MVHVLRKEAYHDLQKCKESHKYFWRNELLVERVLQHGTNLSKISYFCKKNVHVLRTTLYVYYVQLYVLQISLLFVIPFKMDTVNILLHFTCVFSDAQDSRDLVWTFRYQKCQKYMLHTGEINVTEPRLCIYNYALYNSIILYKKNVSNWHLLIFHYVLISASSFGCIIQR